MAGRNSWIWPSGFLNAKTWFAISRHEASLLLSSYLATHHDIVPTFHALKSLLSIVQGRCQSMDADERVLDKHRFTPLFGLFRVS